MNANLFQHLSDSVAETSTVAIETAKGAVTYEDLILLSGQMANALQDRGVNVGDRVAVQVEKSVAALVLYLACMRAGAVFLPLNTAYTLSELDYFIGDAEPVLIVCDPAKHEGIAAMAATTRLGAKVETLDSDGQGSLMVRTTSRRSSTPPARRGARRVPC
jgi:malonyl-CoA/methylmalonyl-CoA synthetase